MKKKTNNLLKKETVIIIILILLTVILSIISVKVYENKKEQENTLFIPILSKKDINEITIDLSNNKTKKKEKIEFTVINYNRKNIIDKKINYKLSFLIKDYKLNIKVYKNDKLMTLEENDLSLSANSLKRTKKQEDKYKIVIESKEDLKKDSKIKIKIEGENK